MKLLLILALCLGILSPLIAGRRLDYSTPVDDGETYTSTTLEVGNAAAVTVGLLTDQDATLFIEFSMDGVNWDSSLTYAVTANFNEVHRLTVTRNYMRVRVVNGSGSDQTFLRLQILDGDMTTLAAPLNLPAGQDADAIVVRQLDPMLEIRLGLFAGYTAGFKFGRNEDIDAAEDVWSGGGTYTGQPATGSPETVQVFSSSGADTSDGTGAQTVRITYLASSTSTEYETEDLILNGTTPVVSVATAYRLNRMEVLTAGSGLGNAGIITTRHSSTTANVFATIPVGTNQSEVACYTVPAGCRMVIRRIDIAGTRGNQSIVGDFSLRVRPPGGVYHTENIFTAGNNQDTDVTEVVGELFEAGSDVKIRCDSVSASNGDFKASFEFIIVKS